jgi:predicted TIM-barrel fold metal-dependent hydrolase
MDDEGIDVALLYPTIGICWEGHVTDPALASAYTRAYNRLRSVTPAAMKPSEYFFRQCLVSADPDETVIAPIIEAVGADYFVWASDYPHIDASFGVVGEIRSRLASLPSGDQAKVLGLNAQRFYDLDVPVPV